MAERLHLDKVGQDFTTKAGSVTVLDDVTITLGTGDRLALIASSGAGKSTLLHIAGLLMRPTRGRVWLGGLDATDLNEHERTRLRG
ncbi:MAG: ATP-binding cassette domain-containing protein, partial [Pseudomonadota bacterium]